MADEPNRELEELMRVLHEALSLFVLDPVRNRRSLIKVLRHIEARTTVKPFVEFKK